MADRLTPGWTRPAGPRMTRALGPHDVVVNVREPGIYEHWHHRDGLRCMTCRASVHVMQRQNGSRWIRHSAADEQRCAIAAASGPEGYEHELLKYWLRDWLRDHDYKADCEKRVGSSVPDVSATAPDGRKLAFEVQLAHLNESDAQRRTDQLLAVGHEVLWITHHCNWVVQLPAVGLNVQAVREGPATEIDGNHYSLREGILTCGPNGRLRGGSQTALETFLYRYHKQQVHWAPLRPAQYGWALDTDWEKHLTWQTHRIMELEKEVREAELTRQQSAADHERELGEIREQLVDQKAQEQLANQRAHELLVDSQKRIQDLDHAWNTAKAAAQQYQRANATIRDALNQTRWGTRFLRRFDKRHS